MAEVTVKQLAEVVGIPVDTLLSQMGSAGLPQGSRDDTVSDEQKQVLLSHLKKSHGNGDDAGRITLKRKTTGTLRPGGSSGKGRSVTVEVRKKRTYVKRSATLESESRAAEERKQEDARKQEEVRLRAEEEARKAREAVLKASAEVRVESSEAVDLLKKEDEADEGKAKKLAPKKPGVKRGSVKAKIESPEEKARRLAEEARLKSAEDARRKKEEDKRKKAEEEAARKTAEEARRLAAELEQREAEGKVQVKVEVVDDESSIVKEAFEQSIAKEHKSIKKDTSKRGRRRKPATVQQGYLKSSSSSEHGFERPTKKEIHEVLVGETIAVTDLAQQLKIKAIEVVKMLMKMGEMVSVNQRIDQETASLVVEELGHTIKLASDDALETALVDSVQRDGEALSRPPVVTVMGHVDHGKTSLLDYIRHAKVTEGEAGGITQHIGAYHVETDKGVISFLDTPGHAAFSAMRARGAQATDIVVVVVAADDGVMPQTEEAVNHAKAAGVPMIIAVNKMDKEQADPERVKSELGARDVVPEEWGGDYPFIGVSAHTGQGIDNLLDAISLQAELMELTAIPSGPSEGVVIEARLEKGRGVVASLLVQQGSLSKGDLVLAGSSFGRVRAMTDENGQVIESAGPSLPVEILGLGDVPNAGDPFMVVADERKAKEVAEERARNEREAKLARQRASKMENLFANIGGVAKVVNVVLKTDVRGSLEAISAALLDLSTDEVKVAIVAGGVGGINESDANLAVSSQAVVFGFNVRADAAQTTRCQQPHAAFNVNTNITQGNHIP